MESVNDSAKWYTGEVWQANSRHYLTVNSIPV